MKGQYLGFICWVHWSLPPLCPRFHLSLWFRVCCHTAGAGEGVEHSYPTAPARIPPLCPGASCCCPGPPGKGQLCSKGARALNSFQKHLLGVEQSGDFIQVSDSSTNICAADKSKTWCGIGTAACAAVPSTEGILSGL